MSGPPRVRGGFQVKDWLMVAQSARARVSLRRPREHRGVKQSARHTPSNAERERQQRLRMRGVVRALSGNTAGSRDPLYQRDRCENARTIDVRAWFFRTTYLTGSGGCRDRQRRVVQDPPSRIAELAPARRSCDRGEHRGDDGSAARRSHARAPKPRVVEVCARAFQTRRLRCSTVL